MTTPGDPDTRTTALVLRVPGPGNATGEALDRFQSTHRVRVILWEPWEAPAPLEGVPVTGKTVNDAP